MISASTSALLLEPSEGVSRGLHDERSRSLLPDVTRPDAYGQADPAVVEEAGEGGPALEHVVHRLGEVGLWRDSRARSARIQASSRVDQRRHVHRALPRRWAGGRPLMFALDREDRVDAAHRLEGKRREVDRVLLRADEAALAMSASSKNLRRLWLQQAASVIGAGLRPGLVELAEPGIGIGLENPGIAGEMPGRMLAARSRE